MHHPISEIENRDAPPSIHQPVCEEAARVAERSSHAQAAAAAGDHYLNMRKITYFLALPASFNAAYHGIRCSLELSGGKGDEAKLICTVERRGGLGRPVETLGESSR